MSRFHRPWVVDGEVETSSKLDTILGDFEEKMGVTKIANRFLIRFALPRLDRKQELVLVLPAAYCHLAVAFTS